MLTYLILSLALNLVLLILVVSILVRLGPERLLNRLRSQARPDAQAAEPLASQAEASQAEAAQTETAEVMAGPGEAPVIGLLGHRGGSGRSVLATALADAWARNGQRVLLIESDPDLPLGRRLGRKPGPETVVQDLAAGFAHCRLPAGSLAERAAWIGQIRGSFDYLLLEAPLEADVLSLVNGVALVTSLEPEAILNLDSARARLEATLRPDQRFLGIQIQRYRAELPLQRALWERLLTDCPRLLLASPCPEDQGLARWAAGLADWPVPEWQWLPARAIDARMNDLAAASR